MTDMTDKKAPLPIVEPDDEELTPLKAFSMSAVRLASQSGLPVRIIRAAEGELAIAEHEAKTVGLRAVQTSGQVPTSWRVVSPRGVERMGPTRRNVIPPDAIDLLIAEHKGRAKPRPLLESDLLNTIRVEDWVLDCWVYNRRKGDPTVTIRVSEGLVYGRVGSEREIILRWPPTDKETLERRAAVVAKGRRGKQDEGAAGKDASAGRGQPLDAGVAGENGPADERSGRAGAGRPPGDGAPPQVRNSAAERTAPAARQEPRGEPLRALTPVADKGDNSHPVVSTGGTSIMGATPVYPISDPMADLANPGGYPSSSIRQEIGRRIQTRMLAKGWNQSELARRSEIGRDNISSYIRGNTLPGAVMVDKIAKALGCSPEDLAPGAGSASRMRGAGLEDPPLEIRQVPGQTDVWVRMVRRLSLDQATRILAILQERPESAAAPAAPPPPTSAPPAIPTELTAATPAFAMNYKPKAAPAQAPAPAAAPTKPSAQAPKAVPKSPSQATLDAVALKQKRIAAAKKAAATRKANMSTSKPAKLPTSRAKSKRGSRR